MQRYNQSVNEVLEENKSQHGICQGLKPKEVELRQAENGFNELKEKKKTSTWELFIDTLKDPMVIILLLVAFVQLFLGEFVESLVIFIVLMINSVVAVVPRGFSSQ